MKNENFATKQQAQPEKKKRGRKRKSDLSAEIRKSFRVESEIEESDVPAETAYPMTETKTTRCGRISKPRPRDLDMVIEKIKKLKKFFGCQ